MFIVVENVLFPSSSASALRIQFSISLIVLLLGFLSPDVRLKTVWFYWGWCYAWAIFWSIVCCKHGMTGTLYVPFIYEDSLNKKKGSPVHVAPACAGSGEGSDHLSLFVNIINSCIVFKEMQYLLSSYAPIFILLDGICCCII